MTGAWTLVAGLAGMFCAAWAGLLALGEDASVTRPQPARRSLAAARIILLSASAVLVSGSLMLRDVRWSPGTIIALGMALVFIAAEALPRALASLSPRLARAISGVALRSVRAFGPLFSLVGWIERRAHRQAPEDTPREDALDRIRREMLPGVFSLPATTVAEIMTPRLDLDAVALGDTRTDVLDAFRRSDHARLLVYDGTADHIVGVIYAKDLLPSLAGLEREHRTWHEYVRQPTFVPEAKTLDKQLNDFQRGPSHISVVVDEFGGTAGVVTREDVIEEIVGEILDEYDDHEQPPIHVEGDSKFWVDGGVTVDDLSEALGIEIDEPDVATVGGLVLAILGRVPRPGEQFTLVNYRVVVEQVIRRRVRRVFFERQPIPDLESESGNGRTSL